MPAAGDRSGTVSRCRRRAPHRCGAQLMPAAACGHRRLGLLLPKEACRSLRCGVPAWGCSRLLSASSCIRCCHRHRHCRFTPATSDRPATVSRCRRRAQHRGGAQLTPAPARGLRRSGLCLPKATCPPPRCGAGFVLLAFVSSSSRCQRCHRHRRCGPCACRH